MSQIVMADATSAARHVISRTLASCAQEMALARPALIQRLRQRDRALLELWRCALAEQIATLLSSYDDAIKAAYLAGDPVTGTIPEITSMHLIIWVQPRTAALRSLMDALQQALSRESGRVFGPDAAGHLHVHMMDDLEIASPRSYSPFVFKQPGAPIEVWKRGPVGCTR